jgi:hypothetical protein
MVTRMRSRLRPPGPATASPRGEAVNRSDDHGRHNPHDRSDRQPAHPQMTPRRVTKLVKQTDSRKLHPAGSARTAPGRRSRALTERVMALVAGSPTGLTATPSPRCASGGHRLQANARCPSLPISARRSSQAEAGRPTNMRHFGVGTFRPRARSCRQMSTMSVGVVSLLGAQARVEEGP